MCSSKYPFSWQYNSKVIILLVTNKRKVLSVEEKPTLIREIEYGGGEGEETSWRISGILFRKLCDIKIGKNKT